MHESKDPSKLQVSLAQTWMNPFLAFFFFFFASGLIYPQRVKNCKVEGGGRGEEVFRRMGSFIYLQVTNPRLWCSNHTPLLQEELVFF